MARNSEKAQSMLFRFRASQAADLGIIDAGRARRPKAITSVSEIPVCEKWRGQVLKDISRKVSKIQDPALSDYQIRELNDDINKLFREKHVWEKQIRTLGGPNYMRGGGGQVFDEEGQEVQGGGRKGYRYFGRARELPGVKEMFEASARKAKEERDAGKDQREENPMANFEADAHYYGYFDELDGKLLEYERKREKEMRDEMAANAVESDPEEDWEPLPGDIGDGKRWEMPTQDQVMEYLLELKRKELLEKLGDEPVSQEGTSKG